MPVPALLKKAPLRAALLLVLAAGPAVADWLPGGNRLDVGSSRSWVGDIGPDGSGGTYVAWLESTVLGPDLRVQHLRPDGLPAASWPAGGQRVAALQNAFGSGSVRLVANPGVGVYLVWIDTRNGESDVYAMYLDALGYPGWALDGLAVCTAPGAQFELDVIPDLAGNIYISWTDARDGTADIYVTRIGTSGFLPGWVPGGTRVTPGPGYHRRATLATDVANGVVIGWMRVEQETDLLAVRFRDDGLRDAAWSENGEPVCVAPGDQSAPQVEPLANGVTAFVWSDRRNGPDSDLYAVGLSSSGAVARGWDANGTPVCTEPGNQVEPALAPDGGGGVIVAWTDFRSGTSPPDIFATRLTFEGAVVAGWLPQGSPVCVAAGGQSAPGIALDASGDTYLTWKDVRTGTRNVRATRLDADGVRQPCWAPDGNPLTSYGASADEAYLAADGIGGAVVAWRDARSSGTHVYAQRLDPSGLAGAEAVPGPPLATPGQVRLTWSVTACRPRWSLERRIGEDRWVLLAYLRAGGDGRIEHADRTVEPGTRVGYRLFPTGEDPAVAHEILVDIPSAPRFAVTRVHPNPTARQVVVAMNLDTWEPARLELLDIAGRCVLRQDVPTFGPGSHEIGLLLPGGLEAGVYRLRLRLGGRSAATTLVLVR